MVKIEANHIYFINKFSRPSSDPEFRLFKSIKKDVMKGAKADDLGLLANQKSPLSIAVLNLILQSDHLDFWEPWYVLRKFNL